MKTALKTACLALVSGFLTFSAGNANAQIIQVDTWMKSPLRLDGVYLDGTLAQAIPFDTSADVMAMTVKWPSGSAPSYVEVGSSTEIYYREPVPASSLGKGQFVFFPSLTGLFGALQAGNADVWLLGPSAASNLTLGALGSPLITNVPEPMPTVSVALLGIWGVWLALKRRNRREA